MRLAASWLCLCLVLKAASDGPQLSAGDIVNAADFSGGRVAPGEIVVLFPSNAGPAVLAGAQLDSNGRVTTSLGETRILFDGIAAPMVYSLRGRMGAVVPYEISNKGTTQVVVEYQGVRSPPVTLTVVDSAPALFTLNSSGNGQAAMLNETGCCNSARNPASRGAVAVLYATGEGQTLPAGISGRVSAYATTADYPVPQQAIQVSVAGEPAEIIYAGAAPHAVAGLLQVNFRVPLNAPLGDAVPIVLTVGNSRSPDGVTMAVRSPTQRVLVIHTEFAIRNWLSRVLIRAGYEVLTARDDQEALAQAGGHTIDLVISNLGSHFQERLETIRAIQAERPQLKLIATAVGLGLDTLRAADLLGAQAVFTKAMTSAALLQRVRELLRSRPVPYVASEGILPVPPNGSSAH